MRRSSQQDSEHRRPGIELRIVALAGEIGASWSTGYYWYRFDRHARNPLRWIQFGWDVLRTSIGLWRDARRFRATHVLVPEFESALRNGMVAIAYETIQSRDGTLPLLTPMSEIAGRMAVHEGAKHLEKPMQGRGLLLAGVPGVAARQGMQSDIQTKRLRMTV